jgi:hypothetical protein
MRKIFFLFIAGFILSAGVSAQTSRRALFLGNSYTYYNNMPQVVADVANSMGDTLFFDSNAPGGYYLGDHFTNPTSLNKIMLGNWDYLVLQDQSMAYAYPSYLANFIPSAYKLDSLRNVYNSCGQTMFYITWGRKNGDTYLCNPPECDSSMYINRTYYEMDSTIQLDYMIVADSLGALTSPVGNVWRYIRRNYPTIELYQADESHPTEAGSYAVACCFYTAIFRKNPLAITYSFTLSATDAAHIRTAVKAVVYDHLLDWNDGANFSFTSTAGNIVSFHNLSGDAISYDWNFGDGNTSTDKDPIHTYAASGDYPVTLIAHHCNYSDTITQLVNSQSATSIEDADLQNGIDLYPNPVSDQFRITHQKNIDLAGLQYKILNIQGQVIRTGVINNDLLNMDVSALNKGMYILQISGEHFNASKRFIKQ